MTNPAPARQTAADESDPWVTLNQAVEIRGKTRVPLLLECLDGKIRSLVVGRKRYYHRVDLEALKSAAPAGDSDDEE